MYQMKNRIYFLSFLFIAPIITYLLLKLASKLHDVKILVTYLAPDLFELINTSGFFNSSFIISQYGILLILSIVFLIEIIGLGFKKSSLRIVLFNNNFSTQADRFYLLMRISGMMHVCALIFSFGICYKVASIISLETPLLFHVQDFNLPSQFILYVLIHTLLSYWLHRLMHTSMLWEIHKVHHSAEQMNVITPLRNHPLDMAIMFIIYAIPLALFDFDLRILMYYSGLNGIYQSWVHSNIKIKSKLLNQFCITPEAHHLHHSIDSRHFNKNFGILTFWDQIFHTYIKPDYITKLKFGVHDSFNYNTGNNFSQIFVIFANQIRRIRWNFL